MKIQAFLKGAMGRYMNHWGLVDSPAMLPRVGDFIRVPLMSKPPASIAVTAIEWQHQWAVNIVLETEPE